MIRFSVFSPEPITTLGFIVTSKPVRRVQPVAFFPSSRSPLYESHRPTPLEFVDTKSGRTVAAVSIPAGIHRALLVFFRESRRPGEPEHFRVYLHEEDAYDAAAGRSLSVLNFSGLLLSGRVGGDRVELSSGPNGPFAMDPSAAVELFTRFHNRDFRSYADTIAIGSGERSLLILLPPFRRGSLEVQSRLLIDNPARNDEAGARGRD